MKPIAEIPGPLQQYMNGLATHDLEKIGGSFADGVQFVTPVRTMGHEANYDLVGTASGTRGRRAASG